jgi:hypothetical protein
MLKRPVSFLALILAISITVTGGQVYAETLWQLVFRYDNSSLELLKADPIPQINKQVRTPGLESAALRVSYQCDWVDASGRTITSSTAELPVGLRSPLSDSEPCRWIIPNEGTVVVRMIGPDPKSRAESIHLTQTSVFNKAATTLDVPSPFKTREWSLSVPQTLSNSALAPGPVDVQKIRDTGPDNNRLVIVVMGDGYTAANLAAGAFTSVAASLDVAFRSKSPWNFLFAATNLYRIDIESNEEGADNETDGVYKDTYLNSSFWVNNIERLLALTGDGYYRAVVAADNLVGPGVWDVILVLVNSTMYGGSGGGIAVSSVHSSSSEIILHELGHSFANLADEYETAYPGFPPGDYEPNVDYDYAGPGLKWLVWVEPGTPLPTPEASPYVTLVGAFEGARYLAHGIYRPWYNCEMRSLSLQFCPVCREAHVLEFTNMVALTDNVDPVPGTTQNVYWWGTQFSVTPLPFSYLQYEWTLDGVPIPGETMPELLLRPGDMSNHDQTLALTITFNTPLVRKQVITADYTWPVVAMASTCCTGIVGDANYNGGYEPTISDIVTIVDHLFISRAPLACYEEADANRSGGPGPKPSDVTISDIALLVDHLFVSRTPLGACF